MENMHIYEEILKNHWKRLVNRCMNPVFSTLIFHLHGSWEPQEFNRHSYFVVKIWPKTPVMSTAQAQIRVKGLYTSEFWRGI